MKINYLLLVTVLCGFSSLLNAQTVSKNNNVSILQGGEELVLSTDINNPSYISITTGSFKIKTPAVDNNIAIQICASSKRQSIYTLKTTREITEHPCFSLGTGAAMPLVVDPEIGLPFYVSNGKSHNYYSSTRRDSSGDNTFIYVEKVNFVRTIPSTESYVIIVIDKNKDKKIQDDEVWFGEVFWK